MRKRPALLISEGIVEIALLLVASLSPFALPSQCSLTRSTASYLDNSGAGEFFLMLSLSAHQVIRDASVDNFVSLLQLILVGVLFYQLTSLLQYEFHLNYTTVRGIYKNNLARFS